MNGIDKEVGSLAGEGVAERVDLTPHTGVDSTRAPERRYPATGSSRARNAAVCSQAAALAAGT
jgi:hypothetical protein